MYNILSKLKPQFYASCSVLICYILISTKVDCIKTLFDDDALSSIMNINIQVIACLNTFRKYVIVTRVKMA
jgi:hypothetical protein